MPVTLSIKDVPDDLAGQLRVRARRNHRSIQGELMAMLEGYVGRGGSANGADVREAARPWGGSPAGPSGRGLDLRTERLVWGAGESTIVIRQTRDGREFTIEDLQQYLQKLPFETPAESTKWIRRDRDRT